MKTKTFFFLCFLWGIATIQLYGQPTPPDNKNTTGTVEAWGKWDYYSIPVYSSKGDQIDWLFGSITYHIIRNYKNGVLLWDKQTFSGEVESVGLDWNGGTGEVFMIKDLYVWKWNADPIATGHFNALGDKGSHYIITYLFDVNTWEYSCVRAISHGN
jgi:hypothetical protein